MTQLMSYESDEVRTPDGVTLDEEDRSFYERNWNLPRIDHVHIPGWPYSVLHTGIQSIVESRGSFSLGTLLRQ